MAVPLRVLVVGPKPSAPDSRGGMATVVAIMLAQRDPRVRVRAVATYVDAGLRRRLTVGVGGLLHATALVLRHRCDVVHVHVAHRGSVLRKAMVLAAARRAGIPAVVHLHSYDFAGWFDGLGVRGQRLVRAALRADRYLALGDALADGYAARLEVPRGRVRVLRNPVVAPDGAGGREGPVRAVFLGRHGRRKGSYDLVEALARINDVDLHVVAAGDGEVDAVRSAAHAAGLDGRLDVRGWVSPADRDGLLANSDVFVLPSHDEGLPMALLEAMGAGLAPVVTPVGAIGEVVTDGVDALVVPPRDAPALAAALRRLVEHPDLREDIAAAARERARAFGVEAWFDALVTVWTELARSAR